MAITKEHKNEILADYAEWVKNSRALVMAEYKGLKMGDIDTLRARLREAGGEFHVVKNTLGKLAFQQAGLDVPEGLFEGSTAVGFAFTDAPAVAKLMTDFTRTSEFFKIKGGFLGQRKMSPEDVKSLADLPPLPVMRATLLGMLQTPSARLARTIAEPARSIAAVFKAFADRSAPEAPVEASA